MFHVYWPMSAFVTLIFVVGTIIAILKWGPKLCKVRHTTLPENEHWQHRAYEQQV